MQFEVITRYEEMQLEIVLECAYPQIIRIQVQDADLANTFLTDRNAEVVGLKRFYVRMPLTPKRILVTVFNEANGNNANDTSFKVISSRKLHLEKRADLVDFKNRRLKSFIKFAQQFAYNASVLECRQYICDDNYFIINYLPQIVDDNGQIIDTPARSCLDAPYIEAAKKDFVNWTFPMRFATLLHEFAHSHLNKNEYNEFEADHNSLLIYLALGYPRVEAHYVWADIFLQTPTEENIARYKAIEQIIADFEKNNFVIFEI